MLTIVVVGVVKLRQEHAAERTDDFKTRSAEGSARSAMSRLAGAVVGHPAVIVLIQSIAATCRYTAAVRTLCLSRLWRLRAM